MPRRRRWTPWRSLSSKPRPPRKASPYVVLDEPAAEGWRAKFEDAERRALDLESRLGGAEARAAGAEAAAETRQRIIDTLQSQKAGQAPPSPPPVPRSTQPRPVRADPTPLLQEAVQGHDLTSGG